MPLRRLSARPRLVATLLGVAVAVAVLLVQWQGGLEDLELVAMDQLLRLRGARPAEPRIVVCDVDAESVAAYGLWPWSRARVARLIDGLAAGGARVIALDVMFAEPTDPSSPVPNLADSALVEAIERSGNVVLGYYFRSQPVARLPDPPPSGAELGTNALFDTVRTPRGGFPNVPAYPAVQPNLESIARAALAQGFFNNERRRGVYRHYDLVARYPGDGAYYPALALQAVARYRGSAPALGFDQRRLIPRLTLGDAVVESDEGGRLWINYRGPGRRFATVSARAVIEGEAPAAVRDALVFVGASEIGIGDLYATPFGGEVPGVDVHAHVADNLLNDDYIYDRGGERLLSYLALFVLAVAVAWLATSIRRHLVGSLLAIGLVATWPVLAYLALVTRGWHLLSVAPVLAGGAALLVALRYQIGQVETHKRQIRRAFERYVAKAIVEEVLANPEEVELRGEERDMTVLFCDVSGFTDMSEKLSSRRVVQRLNEFFTPMTAAVLAAGGTLDKYMGDALMAFFGAPARQADHAARACRAALAMAAQLPALNAGWRGRGEPELGCGVGLNSGLMTVGNMGSETIFDYTVIGDAVNLGSRLEGLTRLYRCPIVVSEHTAAAAGPGFLWRELDRVQVKGKSEPVAIYELLAEHPASAARENLARRYAAGLERYRARDFAAALRIFTDLLAEHPADGPSAVLRERCQAFLESPPPEGWDAVLKLTGK